MLKHYADQSGLFHLVLELKVHATTPSNQVSAFYSKSLPFLYLVSRFVVTSFIYAAYFFLSVSLTSLSLSRMLHLGNDQICLYLLTLIL